MQRALALVGHSLVTTLTRRRMAGVAAVAVAPLALAVAVLQLADQAPESFDGLFLSVGVGLVVPLIALVVGVGALRDDLESGAIVHLVTRGVRRETVLVARMAAAAGATVLASAVALTLPLLVLGGDGVEAWRLALPVGALAGVAYTALFTLLGVAVKRAGLLGLAYLVVWEGVVASSPLLFRYATVAYWVRSIIANSDLASGDPGGNPLAGAVATTPESLAALTVIVLVATVLGALWFGGREFAGPEPEA